MKQNFKILSILSLLIVMSCATKVKVQKFTDQDFNNYETFAYLPNTSFTTDEFKTNTDNTVKESLVTTMNTKMIEKGFTLNTDNPDLLVLLTTSNDIKSNLVNQLKNNSEQSGIGGGISSGPNYATVSASSYKRYLSNGEDEINNRPYKAGSLIVEVFDTKTKELIWLGIADDFKAHISDQTLMTRMVNEVFNKFPGK